MNVWFQRLERHAVNMYDSFPNDKLMMLLDIDGTFFDVRDAIRYIFQQYDFTHGTSHFTGIVDNLDLERHCMPLEATLSMLLLYSDVPENRRLGVLAWLQHQCWSPETLARLHQSCEGILDLVQTMALLPNVHIGLNSSRPEYMRRETLMTLNALGANYGLQFLSSQLFLDSGASITESRSLKVAGLRYFQKQGYRIFAALDSEPANLAAIRDASLTSEILTVDTNEVLSSFLAEQRLRDAHFRALERIV